MEKPIEVRVTPHRPPGGWSFHIRYLFGQILYLLSGWIFFFWKYPISGRIILTIRIFSVVSLMKLIEWSKI